MIIPIGDDNPREKTPFVNYTILGVNIFVFLVLGFRPDYDHILEQYGSTPRDLQFHTIFTSMFLHVNILHLAFNMLYLWIAGDNVEDRLGHLAYLLCYLASGATASLLDAVARSGSDTPAVGASGAIAGVLAMYIVFFPHNRINFFYFFFYTVGTFAMSAIWAVGIWFAMEFVYGYLQLHYVTFPEVAHWAHIGGFFFGLGIGFLIRYGPQIAGRTATEAEQDVFHRAADAETEEQIEEGLREIKKLIRSKLVQGYADQALKLYKTLVKISPKEPLDPIVQLRIAKAYQKRKQHAKAAECLEKYLSDHPGDLKRAEVKLALGVLYSRELSRQGRARQCLSEAVRELKNAKRAAKARKELATIMAPGGEGGAWPQSRFTVMCANEEPIDIISVGKLVAKETRAPQFEVAKRIREHSGFLARNLPLDTAKRAAAMLHANGVRAIVVDEAKIIDLPEPERVAAVSSPSASDAITFRILDASVTKSWADIYLATCGWIEQIPKPPPASMDDDVVCGPIVVGPFGGMRGGITDIIEERRELIESLQSSRRQEPRLFIDFFFNGFREHLRIETDRFDFRSLGIESSPESSKSLRALAQMIEGRVGASCVTIGILSIARGAPRPDKYLTFTSELSFDEYNSWKIELKRRSS